jgi:hypothetical protein
VFFTKGKFSCIFIGDENSSLPCGDANFEADKSLTATGQKTVSEWRPTGQKMEIYSKPFKDNNLNSVNFINKKISSKK